jgi:predicted TIM-barrel enzyme
VHNFPTVGVVDGVYRFRLEKAGMGFDKEIEMIALAHKLGMLTTPYAFDEEQAKEMAKAGADVLVPHMGGTVGGMVGNIQEMTLEEAAQRVQEIHDAAKSVNPEILVICHGGPIAEPEDAEYILKNTEGIVGFYGASSMERLPVERAITGQVKKFREIRL